MNATRFNGRYSKTKTGGPEPLIAAIEVIGSLLGSNGQSTDYDPEKEAGNPPPRISQHFLGDYRIISSQKYEYVFRDEQEWKTSICDQWADIGWLNASISAANGYASLRFDFERSEVSLTVQFPSKERLDKAVAEIEKALELTSMMPGYGETKLAGTKRIFYTANRIDAAWFQTAVKLLRELSRTERYFTSCRVYITSRLTPDFITGRLDEWELAKCAASSVLAKQRKPLRQLRVRPASRNCMG